MSKLKEFNILIEQDEAGYLVASVSELPGCHTQAKTLDQLMKRAQECIDLYLEVNPQYKKTTNKFIGFQKISVSA